MATVLENEIKINKYFRERHNGPNNACPNCVSLLDKKDAGYLKTFFLGLR